MFTCSRRLRNSGIRRWGLVRVGPARMLAMAMVNSTRAPGTGDRWLGLAPKVGPAVLFQHTYPWFQAGTKMAAGGTPVGNGSYLTLPPRTQGRYSLLSMYHGRRWRLRCWRTRSPRGCPAMLRAETENVRAAREGAKNMMRQALPRSQRGALTPPSWHLSLSGKFRY